MKTQNFNRTLNLQKQMKEKSHFLFGPRTTGKSWLVRQQLPKAQVFDLLDFDIYERFLKRPKSLSEEIEHNLVVIDEIQKIPKLLDEVHRLIETKKIKFLLTGSCARKLKRGGANLLAGRARSLELFPLTMDEIPNFKLDHYLNTGGLPAIFQSTNFHIDLKDYVNLYIREEVQSEALVRNIDHFVRFLDVIGMMSGKELNYQEIASDSSVAPRTVANFIEVLKDTLLAFELEPFILTKKRKAITKSKIYLFDVGVAGHMSARGNIVPRSEAYGDAFEHFCLQEIRARLSYGQSSLKMNYWRTQKGEFEVDCILGKEMAIEIKSSDRFQEKYLKGLKAFREEGIVKRHILISRDPIKRVVDGIEVIPYDYFFKTNLST
ncbi:MAG: ATP-binding protein [Bacteriovoracaceae bacterium]